MKSTVALSVLATCIFVATSAAPVPPVTDINVEINLLVQALNRNHQNLEFLQSTLPTPIAQLKLVAAKTSGVISDAATKLQNELELLNTSLTPLINSLKKGATTVQSIAEFVKTNAGKLNQDAIDSIAVTTRGFLSILDSYDAATTKLQIIQQVCAELLQSVPLIATAPQETIVALANKLNGIRALVANFRANVPELSLTFNNAIDSVVKSLASSSTDVGATIKSINTAISSAVNSKIVSNALGSLSQISAPVPSIDIIAVMSLMHTSEDNLIDSFTFIQSLLKSAMAQVKLVSNQSTGVIRDAADNLFKELEKLNGNLGAYISTKPGKIAAIEKIVETIKNNTGTLSPETINALVAMATDFVTVADTGSALIGKLQIIKPIAEALLQASQSLNGAPAEVRAAVANQIDIIRGLIANVNVNNSIVPTAINSLTAATVNILTTESTDPNKAIQSAVKLFNEFLNSKALEDTLISIAQLGTSQNAITFPTGLLNLVQNLVNIPTGGVVQPSVGLPVVGGNFIGNIIQLLGSLLNGLLGNNGLIGGLLGNNGLIGGLLGDKGIVGSLLGSNGLLGGLLGGLSLGGGNNNPASQIPTATDAFNQLDQLLKNVATHKNILTDFKDSLPKTIAQLKEIAGKTTGPVSDAATQLYKELEKSVNNVNNLINSLNKMETELQKTAKAIKDNGGKLTKETIEAIGSTAREFNALLGAYNDESAKLGRIKPYVDALLQALPTIIASTPEVKTELGKQIDAVKQIVQNFNSNGPVLSSTMDKVTDLIKSALVNVPNDVNKALQTVSKVINDGFNLKIVKCTLDTLNQSVNSNLLSGVLGTVLSLPTGLLGGLLGPNGLLGGLLGPNGLVGGLLGGGANGLLGGLLGPNGLVGGLLGGGANGLLGGLLGPSGLVGGLLGGGSNGLLGGLLGQDGLLGGLLGGGLLGGLLGQSGLVGGLLGGGSNGLLGGLLGQDGLLGGLLGQSGLVGGLLGGNGLLGGLLGGGTNGLLGGLLGGGANGLLGGLLGGGSNVGGSIGAGANGISISAGGGING